MRDIDKTVISQFSNSPVITQLIANWNAGVSPDYDLEQFFTFLWDIDTAVGYGLDMLGRRVGVQRVLEISVADYFGFSGPTGASGDSFNAGIFYSGGPVTINFSLTDDTFRWLILAKAAANITNGSIQDINKILLLMFPGRGNCYVQDNLNMSLTYVFDFPLQPSEVAIVTNSGVLPLPSGVEVFYSYTEA